MVFGGTLAVLQAVAPDVYTFVLKIGSFGPGASEFAFPLGVATDLQNRIYIADTETDDLSVANDRIQIFNEDGSYLATIGGPGTGNGQFVYPFGVVVDQNGWVLVADSGNNRIQLFDPTRQFVTSFGTYGNYDTSPTGPPEYRDANGNYIGPTPTLTGLNFPTRVALRPGTRLNDQTDTEGRVAVLDNSNHRVVMLDARLNPLFSFGSFGTDGNALGNFEYPIGVAMDADRVYVADPANHRIQIFTLTGAPIAAFGSKGPANTPDDLQNPYDVQPDSQGRLFVADTDRSRILVLNPDPTTPQTPRCSDVDGAAAAGRCAILATDGTWYDARVLGAAGIGDGEFSFPQALSIDQSARLVVADSDNHRFQVFRGAKIRVSSATLLTAGPVESGQTVTVSVTIANEGATSLMVTPSLTPSLSGTLTSPAPAQIAASATAVFPFSFVTDNIGTLSFTAGGTGQPPVGASIIAPPVTTNSIAVTAAPVPKMNLGIGVTSPAGGSGGLGATVTVQVTVTNTGNVPLTQVTPSVDPSPAGLVIDTTMIQPDLGPLEAGASRPFTFTFTVALVGTVTFRAGATATYAVATPPGGTASISTATSAGPSTTFRVADDVIPPATTIALSTQPTDTGWYRTPVQVTLTASDNVAVRAINYRISGLAAGAASVAGNTATLTISAQGGSDLTYWATDTSGLVETPHTIHFDVDTVLPGISRGGVTPAPNAAGWNNTPPTVKFIGSDGESGVAFVTPDVTVTTNGANRVVTGTAKDFAGNTSQTTITVNVDTKPPSVSCGATIAANPLGWYTNLAAVTIKCTATDQTGLSGILSVSAVCPSTSPIPIGTTTTTPTGTPAVGPLTASASCTIRAEGVHTLVYGEAKDVAGNSTLTRPLTIRIDRTPPVLSCSVSGSPIIWPPNHKMVAWKPVVTVTDAVSPATFKLVAFFSNEDDDDDHDHGRRGDHHDDDMTGWTLNTPDTSGFVRAERSGGGRGRVYTLKYRATDLAGNTASCSLSVTVPREKGSKDDKDRDERNHDGKDCDDKNHRHGDRR